MNEKTEPEKEYPYIDRPMWLYSRSSDKKILALMQQMHELLEEAQRRSYTVVGTSQDMGTGRSMARMGLQQMMRSVKEGHVRAVLALASLTPSIASSASSSCFLYATSIIFLLNNTGYSELRCCSYQSRLFSTYRQANFL